jgi:proteasome lid subunit RPN8/RPN11
MKITDAQLKEIYAHAKETYPRECCGFMLGHFEPGGAQVRHIRQAVNQTSDRPDRFIISGEEYAQADAAAAEAGQEIIGIYHSHPDWPAIPSQTDMDSAWEQVYYLIVSIHHGMVLNTVVWHLADDLPRRFIAHPLEIIDQHAIEE